jgi:hypothetical protein
MDFIYILLLISVVLLLDVFTLQVVVLSSKKNAIINNGDEEITEKAQNFNKWFNVMLTLFYFFWMCLAGILIVLGYSDFYSLNNYDLIIIGEMLIIGVSLYYWIKKNYSIAFLSFAIIVHLAILSFML